MTYQELNRYRNIKLKIISINAELAQITYLSATNYDGQPHGSGVGDPVHSAFIKAEKLRQKLEFQKQRAVEELDKLNDYIESIDDIEMQMIIQKRFIECKSYERIGEEMFMHLSTVKKKLDRFLGA